MSICIKMFWDGFAFPLVGCSIVYKHKGAWVVYFSLVVCLIVYMHKGVCVVYFPPFGCRLTEEAKYELHLSVSPEAKNTQNDMEEYWT